MPYGFVQRACAPARSIHVGAWAGVAVPHVDGHGAISGTAYEALHTGGCWERLSAHVWVCPHAPPTQHRSDRGQRALPAAHRPYSGAPLTPWHAGCGIASQEQFPHAAPPPDNPLLRAGCWREREQHLAAGLRHCGSSTRPPDRLAPDRKILPEQARAPARKAVRPRFDALANADASQAAAASSTAGAAPRSQQESTAFVLGPLGKTFLPRHEEPALTLWQGPCSCCFLSVVWTFQTLSGWGCVL